MNNSPFEVFRRNLAPLMVFLTGLAIFAFVVLPVLDQYMRQNQGTGEQQVMAKFDGQELTRARIEGFNRNHRMTYEFLVELGQRTTKSGRDIQRAIPAGINSQPSEQGAIRTFEFASQAAKQGFALSDSQLLQWLQEYCGDLYNEAELNALARKLSNNQMSLRFVQEQLRMHMLAQVFATQGNAGLNVITPDQLWASFLKFNQKANVETYEFLVSDFVSKVTEEPSESELSDLFEEGKERFPSTQSEEPGFRRRYAASFQYVSGSAETFLADEISKLTDEEVKAEYERRVAGGDFQVEPEPEVKTEEEAKPETEGEAKPETEGEGKPETEADPKPETEPEAKPETEAEAKPETDPEAKPETEGEAKPDQGESSSNSGANAVRLVALQDQDPVAAQDDASESSDDKADDQKEEPTDSDVSVEKPAEEADKPAEGDEKTAEDAEKPAEGEGKPEGEEKPADDDADNQPETEGKEEAPAEPKIKPFEEVRAEVERGLALPRAEARLDALLSELAAQMRLYFSERSIATGLGVELLSKRNNMLLTKVMAKIKAEMPVLDEKSEVSDLVSTSLKSAISSGDGKEFSNGLASDSLSDAEFSQEQRASVQKLFDAEVSTGLLKGKIRPDLEAFASQYGLAIETIGPYNALTISNEPIGESAEKRQGFQQGPSFAQVMFFLTEGGDPYQPVFSPLRTMESFVSGGATPTQYLSWKIEDKQAFVPTFSEARDEVVDTWKNMQARALAKAEAEKIVKQANQAPDKPLAELVPEDRRDQFLNDSIEPFSWMQATFNGSPVPVELLAMLQGNPQQQRAIGYTMGNVDSLNNVGEDFMKAVFSTAANGTSMAVNQDGTAVYVIRATAFTPAIEMLREQFKQPNNRQSPLIRTVAGGDNNKVLEGFFDSVDEQAGFENYSNPTLP